MTQSHLNNRLNWTFPSKVSLQCNVGLCLDFGLFSLADLVVDLWRKWNVRWWYFQQFSSSDSAHTSQGWIERHQTKEHPKDWRNIVAGNFSDGFAGNKVVWDNLGINGPQGHCRRSRKMFVLWNLFLSSILTFEILDKVNVHWRDPNTALDTTSSIESVQEFLKHHQRVNKLALIQCTSPFITRQYLRRAFKAFKKRDCVFSAIKSFKLRWTRDVKTKRIFPVNFNYTSRPRRQDWNGET